MASSSCASFVDDSVDSPTFMEWRIASELAEAVENHRWIESLPEDSPNRDKKMLKDLEQKAKYYRRIAISIMGQKSKAGRRLEAAKASPCIRSKDLFAGLAFEPTSELNHERVCDKDAQKLYSSLGLQSEVVPTKFQVKAAEMLESSRHWSLPQLSLFSNPGRGRTLPVLMAVAAIGDKARGPTVIISTPTGCNEWIKEHGRSFGQNKMPLLHIENLPAKGKFPNVTDYRVIVTTYNYIEHEMRLLREFEKAKAERHQITKRAKTPLRGAPLKPRLVLAQDVFTELGVEGCELLVLDDSDWYPDFARNRNVQIVMENKRATVYMHPVKRDLQKDAMGLLMAMCLTSFA